MKEKIINFVIGLLVGAIISTGVFAVYNSTSCNKQSGGMPGGQMPQMSQGQTPPEQPSGDNNSQNQNNNNTNSSENNNS